MGRRRVVGGDRKRILSLWLSAMGRETPQPRIPCHGRGAERVPRNSAHTVCRQRQRQDAEARQRARKQAGPDR